MKIGRMTGTTAERKKVEEEERGQGTKQWKPHHYPSSSGYLSELHCVDNTSEDGVEAQRATAGLLHPQMQNAASVQ